MIMMGVVTINVVLRFIWEPILGTYEVAGFLEAAVVSFALAGCVLEKRNIAITFVMDRIKHQRTRSVIEIMVRIIGIALILVIAWTCYHYALTVKNSGKVSPTLAIPFYPLIFGTAFGFLMVALVLLVDFFRSLPAQELRR
jgi:TRAP-type C4-dicarboxylate transport system permease small subunit